MDFLQVSSSHDFSKFLFFTSSSKKCLSVQFFQISQGWQIPLTKKNIQVQWKRVEEMDEREKETGVLGNVCCFKLYIFTIKPSSGGGGGFIKEVCLLNAQWQQSNPQQCLSV